MTLRMNRWIEHWLESASSASQTCRPSAASYCCWWTRCTARGRSQWGRRSAVFWHCCAVDFCASNRSSRTRLAAVAPARTSSRSWSGRPRSHRRSGRRPPVRWALDPVRRQTAVRPPPVRSVCRPAFACSCHARMSRESWCSVPAPVRQCCPRSVRRQRLHRLLPDARHCLLLRSSTRSSVFFVYRRISARSSDRRSCSPHRRSVRKHADTVIRAPWIARDHWLGIWRPGRGRYECQS